MTLEDTGGEKIAEADSSFAGSHPAEQDGGGSRSRERRRRPNAEKRALVEMAMQSGSSVREVAACFELSPSQIYTWRKQLADGELDDPVETPVFARVDVMLDVPPASPVQGDVGKIVIAFPSGVSVRVAGSADPAMLAVVLSELGR